jgi:hypothetical protein
MDDRRRPVARWYFGNTVQNRQLRPAFVDYERLVLTNNWAKFLGTPTIKGVARVFPFKVKARNENDNGRDQPARFTITIGAPDDEQFSLQRAMEALVFAMRLRMAGPRPWLTRMPRRISQTVAWSEGGRIHLHATASRCPSPCVMVLGLGTAW